MLDKYGNPDNLTDIVEGTEISLEFVSAEGKTQVSAGRNSYFDIYEIEDYHRLEIVVGDEVLIFEFK